MSKKIRRSARPNRIARDDDVPASVTFFVSARDRRAILDALRRIHRDRAAALLKALNIRHPGETP